LIGTSFINELKYIHHNDEYNNE